MTQTTSTTYRGFEIESLRNLMSDVSGGRCWIGASWTAQLDDFEVPAVMAAAEFFNLGSVTVTAVYGNHEEVVEVAGAERIAAAA